MKYVENFIIWFEPLISIIFCVGADLLLINRINHNFNITNSNDLLIMGLLFLVGASFLLVLYLIVIVIDFYYTKIKIMCDVGITEAFTLLISDYKLYPIIRFISLVVTLFAGIVLMIITYTNESNRIIRIIAWTLTSNSLILMLPVITIPIYRCCKDRSIN
jgi:hypothetical protein